MRLHTRVYAMMLPSRALSGSIAKDTPSQRNKDSFVLAMPVSVQARAWVETRTRVFVFMRMCEKIFRKMSDAMRAKFGSVPHATQRRPKELSCSS